MSKHIMTRMGDGERVFMEAAELKKDLQTGTRDAAERAQIPELDADELEKLFDIFSDPSRAVSVRPGQEVVTSDDGGAYLFWGPQSDSSVGVPMSRQQAILAYERGCGADSASLAHTDYSFKQVKVVEAAGADIFGDEDEPQDEN